MTGAGARFLPAVLAAAVFVTVVAALPRSSPNLRSPAPRATLVTVASRVADRVVAPRAAQALAYAIAADAPDAVDLLAVAATSGCNVHLAVEAVARHHDGPVADALRGALVAVRGGERLADALASMPAALPEPAADALRPVVAVLVESERYGTPLAPALQRLGADLRVHRQRRAEERARKAPVRMLLPLVSCVLPAFALLTVIPLLAGIADRALADLPAPSVPLDSPKDDP